MNEISLTVPSLKHHLHQQSQYSSDISALLTSVARQRQRLLGRSGHSSSHKQQESIDSLQQNTIEDNCSLMGEDEVGVVVDEGDTAFVTDLPFPLDDFSSLNEGKGVYGLDAKTTSDIHIRNDDQIISELSSPTRITMESDSLEEEFQIKDPISDFPDNDDEYDASFSRKSKRRTDLQR